MVANKNLYPISEIIKRASELGVNFGSGNPENRIRYYIKFGLLPHAKRKSFSGGAPSAAFRLEVVDRLVQIEKLRKRGKSIPEQKQLLLSVGSPKKLYKPIKTPVVIQQFEPKRPPDKLLSYSLATTAIVAIILLTSLLANLFIVSDDDSQVLGAQTKGENLLVKVGKAIIWPVAKINLALLQTLKNEQDIDPLSITNIQNDLEKNSDGILSSENLAIKNLEVDNISGKTTSFSDLGKDCLLSLNSSKLLVCEANYFDSSQIKSDIEQVTKEIIDSLDLSSESTIITNTTTSSSSTFKNILVTGQSTITASGSNDSLRFIAGSNITLTTDAATKTVTINSTGGGGGDSTTLDTIDSSQFLRSDTGDNFTVGTLTFDAGTTLSVLGAFSCIDCVGDGAIPNTITIAAAGITGSLSDGQISDILTISAGSSVAASTITGSIIDAQVSDTLTASNLVAGGSVVADSEVDDNLTIDATGSVNWTALSNYPSACSAGTAITTLADSPTCSSFLTSVSFTDIGAGTNTNALLIGTGGSLGVTGSGTITATGLVAGSSVVADSEVDDNITVDWAGLQNYPAGCLVGTAITTLADSPTCTAFTRAGSTETITGAWSFDNLTIADTAVVFSSGSSGLDLQGGTTTTLSVYNSTGGQIGGLSVEGVGAFGSFLATNSNIHLNYSGPDGNSYLYFYDATSSTGESINWSDSSGQFDISDDLSVTGAFTASSTITGTTLNGTTGINTGAGAGTNRIDVSGNLLNIGTLSLSGDITWTAATPNIAINNTESMTITDGTNTLLTLADGGTQGNLTVTGTGTFSSQSTSITAGSGGFGSILVGGSTISDSGSSLFLDSDSGVLILGTGDTISMTYGTLTSTSGTTLVNIQANVDPSADTSANYVALEAKPDFIGSDVNFTGKVVGLSASAQIFYLTAGKTISDFRGFESSLTTTNSGVFGPDPVTITNYSGLRIVDPDLDNSSGAFDTTITNAYGIYIEDFTAEGTGAFTNTPYGIYQAGTTDYNILAGQTRIGSTSNPDVGVVLDVTGNMQLNGFLSNAFGDLEINDGIAITGAGTIYDNDSALNIGDDTLISAGIPDSANGASLLVDSTNASTTTNDGYGILSQVFLFNRDTDAGASTITAALGAQIDNIWLASGDGLSWLASIVALGTLDGSVGAGNNGITNLVGVLIKDPTLDDADLTVTNPYGLYIEDISADGATFTNTPFAIYQSGTNDNNYFGGQVRFDSAVVFGAQSTLAVNDTTPDVSASTSFITANSSGTLISDFDAGAGTLQAGHVIFVEANDANTDFDCTSSGLNCGSTDITTIAAGDFFAWYYDGTDWHLVSFMDDSDNQNAGSGFDLAELFPSTQSLQPGEVVSIDTNSPTGYVKKSTEARDSKLVGIVSTDPGITLGSPAEMTAYPIALAGRVPVKVSNENGEIKPGDPLTSSSTPGVAMKATRSSPSIGKALESFDCDGQTCQGKILVLVATGWYSQALESATDYDFSDLEDITFNSLNTQSLLIGNNRIYLADNGALKFDGKVEINSSLLVAGEITAKKLNVSDEASGKGVIKAGQQSVFIETTLITTKSKVLLTLNSLTSQNLAVTRKDAGTGFEVSITSPETKDIKFDWFVVN